MMSSEPTPSDLSALCQSCGACCAYSPDWPRFSLESDEALALIPAALVDDSQGKMRCEGDRCAALTGKVGVATACSIYAGRPDVCRACQPGDPECNIARARYGFAAVILGGLGP
jgi:Fe-S-cluster containining protein